MEKEFIIKRVLLISLLLIVGCAKPINENSLVDRNGVKYQQDSQKPYSGEIFDLYDNGNKKIEGSYKDGIEDGLWTYWDNDGSKYEGKVIRKDDEDGTFLYWYDNEKTKIESHKTYKDGEEDGKFTSWYENGQKEKEETYKNGKENGKFTYW